MKLGTTSKTVIIEIICLLYILLFVYAAISKLLDFENFELQMGLSPLLSAFAKWITILVPFTEIVIVLFLILPKFRLWGLFCAISLMSMFTAYIFIILHYSSFVPCSCGGILEKMTWNVHLIFNIIFVFLAALGILFSYQLNKKRAIRKSNISAVKKMTVSIGFSVLFIVVLFLFSEQIMHHENPFIRRYPQHPVMFTDAKDLKFNSYYFAGYTNNKLYLGNFTDPLHLVSFDANLTHRQNIRISFTKNIRFNRVRIIVRASHFYLMDGTKPKIYRGDITEWKLNKELQGSSYFTLAEPIDSSTIIFRANNGKNSANILGLFKSKPASEIHYNKGLLQKQIDGVFDTDGMLLYNEKLQRALYLYYYRNEYLQADNNLNLISRHNTIDTISKAQIKIAYLKKGRERAMSSPPQLVNAHAAISNNLLFVHSLIKGKYEDNKLWDQASIIDVYDINKGTYLLSFSIYNIKEKKMQSFFVTTTHLYALIGNQIAVHELGPQLQKEMKSSEK